MISESWNSVFSRFPFNSRILAVGAIGAILTSTTRLAAGDSADIATTAGVAGFVAFSVGTWLGVWLVIWMLRSAGRIHLKLLALLDTLDSEPSDQTLAEQTLDSSPSLRTTIRLWISFDLAGLALCIAPIPILILLLDFGYGLFDLGLWRFLAIGFGIVAAVSFAIQRLGLALRERQIRRLLKITSELRKVETSESHRLAVQDTVRLRNQSQNWRKVGSTVSRWVKRVTGISLDEVGRDSVPGTAT